MSAIQQYKHYLKTNVFKVRDKIKAERKIKKKK
jgi:hypothetical protein